MKIHKNLIIAISMSILMSLYIGIGTCSEGIIVAEAGGPYEGFEGVPTTINASGSSGPGILNYSWDLNGDGKYEAYGFEIIRIPQDGPKVRTILLNVSNETGAFATDVATWTIKNADPIVHIGPDQTTDEGYSAQFYTNFSDVQVDMNQSTVHIDYGDGHTEDAAASPSGRMSHSHTYISKGVYTVTVTITDKDGGTGSDTLTVTVDHVDQLVDSVPPPVNQYLGLYDTDVVNFKKSYLCRNCHPGANTIHHMVAGYNCNVCHPNGYSVKDIDINCLNCHNGSAYYANPNLILGKPHHNTTKNSASNMAFKAAYVAINRKCNICHGDGYLDNYNDGHYIPSTSTSMTSTVCNNCHNQNLSLDRPILTNRNTHHNATDTTQGFQCTYCHADSGNNFPIKGCEQCHSLRDLHNIETASPGRNLLQTITDEITGYGHIGNNTDCKGCHTDNDHGDNCKLCHPITQGVMTTMFAGSISGTKFNDSNGNGVRDAGEAGVAGVNINIFSINVDLGTYTFVNSTRTDVNGNYTLINLSGGYYRVRENQVAYSQTFPLSGAPYYVTLGKKERKTGLDFGNQQKPPGNISGIVFNDTNGNGIQDNGENGIPGINVTLVSTGASSITDSSGIYTLKNVPIGNQMVYQEFIFGYVTTTQISASTSVSSGATSVVNFGNMRTVLPLPDVYIPQMSGTQNGVPTVNRPGLTELIIQKDLSDVSNVLGANLTLRWINDGTVRTVDMVQIGTTGVWKAVLSAPFSSGTAHMTFKVDVSPAGPGSEDMIQIGDIIFLDPSGQILSACNNKPVENATATLYVEFPPTTGNFIVSPPGYQLEQNPQVTLADGYYGWMTIPGTYKVGVTKTGYNSGESELVTVPPQKTGLNVLLTPTDSCPPVQQIVAEAGGPYTVYEGIPVTINASGSSGPPGDILTYEWNFEINKVIGFEITRTPRDGPLTRTIVLNVTNGKGGFATDTALWTVLNVPPKVEAGSDKTINEGDIAYLTASFSDVQPDMNASTARINYGDGTTENVTANLNGTISSSHKYVDDGIYTVTVTVTDKDGGVGSDTLTVTANNVKPVVSQIISPIDPQSIANTISVSSSFTDVGIVDTHAAVLDWDDGTKSAGTVTESGGSGSVTASHVYSTPGIYTITVSVTDKDGGTGTATSSLIVIYDPNGGFVTGGGWINSPAGAYEADLTLVGRANFGFVSKYQKGATVPTGETEFQFKVGNLNFHSSIYDWLVIAGARAQYKGSGTINGEGDYAFMLTAIDAQVNGGGETDKFRMKIWNNTNGNKVYDNQNGATDDAEPTTAISGGSIVIHKID